MIEINMSSFLICAGAAAIIERAGQARHAAGIWGGVAVIISGVLGTQTLYHFPKRILKKNQTQGWV